MNTENNQENSLKSLEEIIQESTQCIIDILNETEKKLNDLGISVVISSAITQMISHSALSSTVLSHHEYMKDIKMKQEIDMFMSIVEKSDLPNNEIQ